MTRKDYKAIAEVLAEYAPDEDSGPASFAMWRSIVEGIGSVMKRDNGRFDFARWHEAVGCYEIDQIRFQKAQTWAEEQVERDAQYSQYCRNHEKETNEMWGASSMPSPDAPLSYPEWVDAGRPYNHPNHKN